jgi:hypothetical protein
LRGSRLHHSIGQRRGGRWRGGRWRGGGRRSGGWHGDGRRGGGRRGGGRSIRVAGEGRAALEERARRLALLLRRPDLVRVWLESGRGLGSKVGGLGPGLGPGLRVAKPRTASSSRGGGAGGGQSEGGTTTRAAGGCRGGGGSSDGSSGSGSPAESMSTVGEEAELAAGSMRSGLSRLRCDMWASCARACVCVRACVRACVCVCACEDGYEPTGRKVGFAEACAHGSNSGARAATCTCSGQWCS